MERHFGQASPTGGKSIEINLAPGAARQNDRIRSSGFEGAREIRFRVAGRYEEGAGVLVIPFVILQSKFHI